jgi:hypothetical protein
MEVRAMLGVLSVKNGKIVDDRGHPVILKGVNDVGEIKPDLGAQVIEAGFNHVRLPIMLARIAPDNDREFDFRSVDHGVQQATDAGLAVLLDLHQSQWSRAFFEYGFGMPPRWYPRAEAKGDRTNEDEATARAAFYRNEPAFGGKGKPWDAVEAALVALAERYAGTAGVIGLDLLNEPGFGPKGGNMPPGSTLRAFYERMGHAVHRAAPEWLLVCENATWTNVAQGIQPFKTPEDLPKLAPRKLVGSIHYYPEPTPKKGETSADAAARQETLVLAQGDLWAAVGAPCYYGEFDCYGMLQEGGGQRPWPEPEARTRAFAKRLADGKEHAAVWALQVGAGPALMRNWDAAITALRPWLRATA